MHPLHEPVAALIREVARDIMMPRFRKLATHEFAEKTPGDFVTIVDRESEARLGEGLARLLPEARIIGEESAAADPSIVDHVGDGTAWIIDPLDGTNNFTEGKSPFAIMIGLAVDGEREAGWIYDPVLDRLVHAARGRGCTVNGERVTARRSEGGLPKAATATYFMPEDRQADVRRRAEGRLEIVDIPRCAGEQYPRLMLGINDIALFERTHVWDHAPGALMLEEAGGMIARNDGSPYRLDVPGKGAIAASTPELWALAKEVLFD
ncbi:MULTISPECIES: inositol monophosphatase family protein [unclassified Sphingomonas]|uniref:inositol monophosphatase family protein n=1 Tax=unclassified Sphingomonas TaxID=196159 RepID=UPI0006F6EA78|nr:MULTISPECIES: inositol monophosphatase family protein [unclassified Sphingomonas]KQX25320.1 inositol monophosphatase [Sphingomonas sp. Root1294]KQY66312.1 inositol monophosphatase [Sphingomonas sp. Root50]KRB90378.1 inositol monophosphatase [Sphingomonas sp. Root720]